MTLSAPDDPEDRWVALNAIEGKGLRESIETMTATGADATQTAVHGLGLALLTKHILDRAEARSRRLDPARPICASLDAV
jgi:hypothetical protein